MHITSTVYYTGDEMLRVKAALRPCNQPLGRRVGACCTKRVLLPSRLVAQVGAAWPAQRYIVPMCHSSADRIYTDQVPLQEEPGLTAFRTICKAGQGGGAAVGQPCRLVRWAGSAKSSLGRSEGRRAHLATTQTSFPSPVTATHSGRAPCRVVVGQQSQPTIAGQRSAQNSVATHLLRHRILGQAEAEQHGLRHVIRADGALASGCTREAGGGTTHW